MNHALIRLLFGLLLLVGPLAADEWSRWVGVGGDLAADRGAAVVVRSKRDESGDQKDRGYLFVYELHNQSGTQRARVTLFFPVQDPATGRWLEIDRDKPTIVHDLPPMGNVTGTRYSPSPRGLSFESDVKWPEELAAENERKAADKKPANASNDSTAKSDPAEPQAEFEGVPIDLAGEGKKALQAKIGNSGKDTFMVVIEVFRQDDTGDEYGGDVNGNEAPRTWQTVFTELMESYRDPAYAGENTASFEFLSSTRAAMKIRFDVIYARQLHFILDTQVKPPARIFKLVRLKSGG